MTGNEDEDRGDEIADLAGLFEQLREVRSAAADAMAAELELVGPEAFLNNLQERALVSEAEDAAGGYRAVTITHGDIESEAEAEAVQGVVDRARSRSPLLEIRGGSDYLTVVVPPPGADEVVAELVGLASAHAVTYWWWRVDLTSRPVRR